MDQREMVFFGKYERKDRHIEIYTLKNPISDFDEEQQPAAGDPSLPHAEWMLSSK